MRDPDNIRALFNIAPDFIGFIFYEKSSRFVKNIPVLPFPDAVKKVGVFVNENLDKLLATAAAFPLDLIQLHGAESPDYCRELASHSYPLIKAFSVDAQFDFSLTEPYQEYCDYFLFDTKGPLYGGNGQVFDWSLLQQYQGDTPFFLSGGLGPDSVSALGKFQHTALFGFDINSGFEQAPAMKNIQEIKEFKQQIP